MVTLSEAQTNAASVFANAAVTTFSRDGVMHPGTVVAATARMAGTYQFRSFDLKLPGVAPGQAVLSKVADEQAPMLIQIAAEILAKVGITLDNSQAGNPTEPKHKPTLAFLDTQRKLEPVCEMIKDRVGLSNRQAAQSIAVGVALLIRHCSPVMDPSASFGIAAYGFIEGAKTAPDPVQVAQATEL